ncbi:hypothetical protein EYR36_009985 [Pleurotus pulmonarius]|nr:hypothetical protein EYR36_009985 [Pleurotus pulmonarius]
MMNAAPAINKGSPLDNALVDFSQSRTATPATATKANTNHIHTTERQAQTTPPAYRPGFAYLGDANPDIYVTPGPASSPIGTLRLAFPHVDASSQSDGKVVDAAKASADLKTNSCK